MRFYISARFNDWRRMTDLYSRLFKYQTTEAKSPLEDFSTEILCNFLNRISSDAIDKFLRKVVFSGMKKEYNTFIKNHKTDDKDLKIDWETQYSININDATKRPDLLGFVNNKPAILIEVKIGAGFTYRMQQSDDGDTNYIYQLEDYGKWLNEKNTKAILVLLSRFRPPPDDFLYNNKKYGVKQRNYVTWFHVYRWLKLVQEKEYLAQDFIDYLLEQNMANESPTNKDFSELETFIVSNAGSRIGNMMLYIKEELEKNKKYTSFMLWGKDRKFLNEYEYYIDHESNCIEGWVALKFKPKHKDLTYLAWGLYYPTPNIKDEWGEYAPNIPKVPYIYISLTSYEKEVINNYKNVSADSTNIKHGMWNWNDKDEYGKQGEYYMIGFCFRNLSDFISDDKDTTQEILKFINSGFKEVSKLIKNIIK